ncbi:hypothetical protein Cgig2_006722 [Carnegiea gigantea]|uniref:ABC1 atypical kinase-like domain-containing protein n=1 Tax=Carnegiea gigantea TaxID=171969 RepID=A0A9Q1Q6B8_9CARY|nr:hypothetical protein Cgig2_006722 [Carnegiea gigantea]
MYFKGDDNDKIDLTRKDRCLIKVPKIYWKYTSKAVLTMEWIKGIKLTDEEELAKAQLKRKELVDMGLYCSLRQLLEVGFFHADPHPGNLVATDDGCLAYFDFGMMGDIPRHYRVGLIRVLVHFVNRDSLGLANDFLSLGFIPEGVDIQLVSDALQASFGDGTRQSRDFQLLAATRQLVQAKKIENLLPLPFSEIFNMSSLLPITLRSNDLLSIATNFLHPPLIIPAKTSSAMQYEPESDEKERARYQPRVQMAHRRSKRQDQDHLRAVLETESRKQSAGEIPASFRSPEKSPATDMPAPREPAGTDMADQPSPHFGRGETHPPESDMRKRTRYTRKSGNASNRRPVKGYRRLPES